MNILHVFDVRKGTRSYKLATWGVAEAWEEPAIDRRAETGSSRRGRLEPAVGSRGLARRLAELIAASEVGMLAAPLTGAPLGAGPGLEAGGTRAGEWKVQDSGKEVAGQGCGRNADPSELARARLAAGALAAPSPTLGIICGCTGMQNPAG